jgi:hypothetical protein
MGGSRPFILRVLACSQVTTCSRLRMTVSEGVLLQRYFGQLMENTSGVRTAIVSPNGTIKIT